MKQKLSHLSIAISDAITKYIGTWNFVFYYTAAMLLWITFHKLGILHIDNANYMDWNLFLSWFAGIQASILMMSADRQAAVDRKRIAKILHNVDMLEEILTDFIDEQEEGKHGTKKD